jgi:hypothetical protein
LVNGNPAISYYIWGTNDLKYVRANDAAGSSWETPVVVDSDGDVGRYTSLALVDGNPAISYTDFDNQDLKYVRANDANGDDWGTPVTIDSTGDVGSYTSLAIVNGCPAISYTDWTNWDLKYARATTSTGGSASDWTQIVTVDSAGSVGESTSLAVVDGCPAISYYDSSNGDLKYARATTSTGGSASDWTQIVTVDSGGNVGAYTSLAVVNGCPAICYTDYVFMNANLKYARATTSTGGSASDWTLIVTVDNTGDVGYYTSLAVVDGYPAISNYDCTNLDLRYIRAADADGINWGTPVVADSTGNVGEYSVLMSLHGNPAIAYYRSDNGNLKFARLY